MDCLKEKRARQRAAKFFQDEVDRQNDEKVKQEESRDRNKAEQVNSSRETFFKECQRQQIASKVIKDKSQKKIQSCVEQVENVQDDALRAEITRLDQKAQRAQLQQEQDFVRAERGLRHEKELDEALREKLFVDEAEDVTRSRSARVQNEANTRGQLARDVTDAIRAQIDDKLKAEEMLLQEKALANAERQRWEQTPKSTCYFTQKDNT